MIIVFGGITEILDRHRRDVRRQTFDEGPHAHAGVVHLRQLFVREGFQGRLDRADLIGGQGRRNPCQHAGDKLVAIHGALVLAAEYFPRCRPRAATGHRTMQRHFLAEMSSFSHVSLSLFAVIICARKVVRNYSVSANTMSSDLPSGIGPGFRRYAGVCRHAVGALGATQIRNFRKPPTRRFNGVVSNDAFGATCDGRIYAGPGRTAPIADVRRQSEW